MKRRGSHIRRSDERQFPEPPHDHTRVFSDERLQDVFAEIERQREVSERSMGQVGEK